MKISTFLLFAVCVQTYANGVAQEKIDLSVKNMDLKKLFSTIEKKTDYHFLYYDAAIPQHKKVDLQMSDASIEEVLDKAFLNTLLKYKIMNNNLVVISSADFSLVDITVKGRITDEKNLPLVGASIRIKGSTVGTTSNANGEFSLRVPAHTTIVITHIGYQAREMTIDKDETITVQMQQGGKALDDVVVTALGISKEKRALGYATSTIKSDVITEAGSPNVVTALYGDIPGVKIAAAPGGATSGVSVIIRGASSINYQQQPLLIIDGVPARNGDFNTSSGRIGNNGISEINPEDVESVTVLKGAAAAALYGSEASNGVILLTTKSGKGKKGFGIEFSSYYDEDHIAYMPRFQTYRGPGHFIDYSTLHTGNINASNENGLDSAGWDHVTYNGTTYRSLVNSINTGGSTTPNLYFGPKYDGQPTIYWDHQVRPYLPQKNSYKDTWQTAHNQTTNIAFTNNTDKTTTRFSYTYNHSEGLSLNARNDKHNFSLNNTFRLTPDLTIQTIINYFNWHIHDRPTGTGSILLGFGGMLGPADNGSWYRKNAQTSLGYKYVTGTNQSLTPNENISFGNFKNGTADYVYDREANDEDENENRINGVIKADWKVNKDFLFTVRTSTDFTNTLTYNDGRTQLPLSLGNSGSYSVGTFNDEIYYGDAKLNYTKNIVKDFNLNASVGYTVQYEKTLTNSLTTNGGLSVENKFDLSASVNPVTATSAQGYLLKDALFGIVDLSYKNYLFLEGTLRQDRTSTMPPGHNTFYYPAVNLSYVLSDALSLPATFNYLKVRASYGLVGNYPQQYISNVSYGLYSVGGYPYTTVNTGPYGNEFIRPEKRHEAEAGVEGQLLKSRLGFELTYYYNKITDQITNLTLPNTTGATSILQNAGSLSNAGIEVNLTATPVKTKNFTWSMILNFTHNTNKLLSLASGQNELLLGTIDGEVAYKAKVGRPLGDYWAPTIYQTKGQNTISANGLYLENYQQLQNVGNSQETGVGGFRNTFKYKNFALNFSIDYKIGGSESTKALQWLTALGYTKNTLQATDAAHGGLKYYQISNNGAIQGVQTSGGQGPSGQRVYDNGMLLKGVQLDGTPNTVVVSSAYYYRTEFNSEDASLASVGPTQGDLEMYYVAKNTYFKFREINFAYSFPQPILSKIHATNLSLSVFGRNLFYIYRTIKDADAEQFTSASGYGFQNGSTTSDLGNTNPSSRSYGVMLRANF
ncbi:MAG: SusC/RagA family TonB-linked outer membrane protein [Puia sp.]|nr:SusC/RagA family TonB-linked outer membrane protein [Puia sp.]